MYRPRAGPGPRQPRVVGGARGLAWEDRQDRRPRLEGRRARGLREVPDDGTHAGRVEEINAKGGVLGHRIEILSEDDESRPAPAARKAERSEERRVGEECRS